MSRSNRHPFAPDPRGMFHAANGALSERQRDAWNQWLEQIDAGFTRCHTLATSIDQQLKNPYSSGLLKELNLLAWTLAQAPRMEG